MEDSRQVARSNIGRRIANLRKQRGFSQEQLAGEAYSRNYISQVEQGKAIPSPEALNYLVKRLGRNITDFVEDYKDTDPTSRQLLEMVVQLAKDGAVEEAEAIVEEVESTLQTSEQRAHLHYYCALKEKVLGNHERAVEILHRAAEETLKDRGLLLYVKVQFQLGWVHTKLRNLKAAEQHYRFGIDLYKIRKIRNRTLFRNLNRNLANVLFRLKKYEMAEEQYEKTLAIAEEDRDMEAQAATLLGLGLARMCRGAHEEAMKAYEDALVFYKTLDDAELLSRVYNNRGMLHRREGRYEEAREDLLRSLELKEGGEVPVRAVYTLNELVELERQQGNREEAWEYLSRSLDLLAGLDDADERVYTLRIAVEMHLEEGDWKDAMRLLQEGRDPFRETDGGQDWARLFLRTMRVCLENEDDPQEVVKSIKDAQTLLS